MLLLVGRVAAAEEKKDFGEDLEMDKKLTAPLLCLTLSGVFLNDHFSRKTMLIISV